MCHRLVVVLIFFPLVLTHRGRSFFQDVNDVSRTSTFDDEWVVETSGGSSAAHQLAQAMGYKITGEVLGFKDMYRLRKSNLWRSGRNIDRQLADDVRVVWAEAQFGKRRQKRGFIDSASPSSQRPLVRSKRADSPIDPIKTNQRRKRNDSPQPRKPHFRFNDQLWDHQWYMHDTRTLPSLPRLDLHVLPVYDMGFTGRGVTVVILDDGLEFNHTDIRKNYNSNVSYDMNDDDYDPSPRKMKRQLNSHGTRCAGEIAMEANNEKCGVGVAFNAQIGGIRMLDGIVSDRVEASSLIYALDQVDIYCASWGPTDDGRTVEGPGRLTRHSLHRGITQGRQGKGVIYVWAAGNGGRRGDNCNCDGYVSSIYTLSIGSVSEQGAFPWYGERCASTMAVTYSSGAYSDQKIATIDLDDQCTMDHTGTSAAAPLAAGIIALALEANGNLTWRDVQHLVVWTSEYFPLQDNFDWQQNSAGFRYSTRFGFGLMNAASYVQAAVNWTSVPQKSICYVSPANGNSAVTFTSEQSAVLLFESDACRSSSDEINYLEHVEVVVTLEYPIRGRLEIELVSPSGSRTQVLQPRHKDVSSMGFVDWAFMSVHTWGEDPQGQWQLIVKDKVLFHRPNLDAVNRLDRITFPLP